MPQNNKELRKKYNAKKYLENKGLKKDLNIVFEIQEKIEPIIGTIEILLINEYRRMLEFQNTHNSYMIWITKINLVNIHILSST
jgi:hypothetical protein